MESIDYRKHEEEELKNESASSVIQGKGKAIVGAIAVAASLGVPTVSEAQQHVSLYKGDVMVDSNHEYIAHNDEIEKQGVIDFFDEVFDQQQSDSVEKIKKLLFPVLVANVKLNFPMDHSGSGYTSMGMTGEPLPADENKALVALSAHLNDFIEKKFSSGDKRLTPDELNKVKDVLRMNPGFKYLFEKMDGVK